MQSYSCITEGKGTKLNIGRTNTLFTYNIEWWNKHLLHLGASHNGDQGVQMITNGAHVDGREVTSILDPLSPAGYMSGAEVIKLH